MKINLGSGSINLESMINVDNDSLYCDIKMDAISFLKICNNSSISVLLADHLLEHLSFIEEEEFFNELARVIKTNGVIHIKVPDFEWLCKKFFTAKENEYSFYKLNSNSDYFGGEYDENKRWSFLIANFYGHQDGKGQFHKNGFTTEKLKSIANIYSFECTIDTYFRKKTQCLHATYRIK